MSLPWISVAPLGASDFATLRRRAIFDCNKWDPQMEDESAIAPHPLILHERAWRELSSASERLAAETLAAEQELAERPELHAALGFPRAVRRALGEAQRHGPSRGIARLIRFDFHFTTDGWRISEANTDVPGGLNEASGFAGLFAPWYRSAVAVGDPVADYADALLGRVEGGACIALVHATAYTDDRQVMTYLARTLASRGARAVLVSPAQLSWSEGRASLACEWAAGTVDAIVRFFPGEWLPNLAGRSGWQSFFAGARTPLSNPAVALLTQSKRFPLVWDALRTPLPTWRALLPETRDPRDCAWRESEGWVLKPALGRVGEDVGIREVIPPKEWRLLARSARWRPRQWVAQRRFVAVPLERDGTTAYPCVGVYTIDGRVAGAYGRLARRPLIDWRAQDMAVMRTVTTEARAIA